MFAIISISVHASLVCSCAAKKSNVAYEMVSDTGTEQATRRRFGFDDEQPDGPPRGWRIDATQAGRGGSGASIAHWHVVADRDAASQPHVLAITAPTHSEDQTYNICWTKDVRFHSGRISLRFKCLSGEVDQGGGPIWRVKDRDNYYICRANPLESNFRVYKVVNGLRKQLASAPVQMTPGADGGWHTIEVEHDGDRIVCILNSSVRLEIIDSELPLPGGVGLWTKADAAVHFDDLYVQGTSSSAH